MAVSKMIVTVILMSLVALAGCSDDNPTVIPTNVVDTAPPAAPANVDLAYDGVAALVSWDANTVDADLAGFIVTRERYGVTETLVASPAQITSFEDPAPLAGSSSYHVYAVDTSGNESAVATVYLTVTLAKPDSERATD